MSKLSQLLILSALMLAIHAKHFTIRITEPGSSGSSSISDDYVTTPAGSAWPRDSLNFLLRKDPKQFQDYAKAYFYREGNFLRHLPGNEVVGVDAQRRLVLLQNNDAKGLTKLQWQFKSSNQGIQDILPDRQSDFDATLYYCPETSSNGLDPHYRAYNTVIRLFKAGNHQDHKGCTEIGFKVTND